MIGLLSLAALLAAQSVTSLPGPEPKLEGEVAQKDVAFDSLRNGQLDNAVTQLEARLLEEPQDPALLINLGAAYAGQERYDRAGAAYRAALDSPVRYRLELADGTWIDSRQAARLALRSLKEQGGLALR